MHRFLCTALTLAMAVVLALAIAVPVMADETERPFRGSIAGYGDVVPDPACPIGLRTRTWGSGWITHLGLTTMTSSHCTPAGLSIVGGVQTFVAANGDRLEMTYTATVEPFDFVEGAVMIGPGQNVITGGDGRFAGAGGQFDADFRGILHFETPMELAWTYEGVIRY